VANSVEFVDVFLRGDAGARSSRHDELPDTMNYRSAIVVAAGLIVEIRRCSS
jgi:hypothetical protein